MINKLAWALGSGLGGALLVGCVAGIPLWAPPAFFSADSITDFDVAEATYVIEEGIAPDSGEQAWIVHVLLSADKGTCADLQAGQIPAGELVWMWMSYPKDDTSTYGPTPYYDDGPAGTRPWHQGGGGLLQDGVCDPFSNYSGAVDVNFYDEEQGILAGDFWGAVTAGLIRGVFDADVCDVDLVEVPAC